MASSTKCRVSIKTKKFIRYSLNTFYWRRCPEHHGHVRAWRHHTEGGHLPAAALPQFLLPEGTAFQLFLLHLLSSVFSDNTLVLWFLDSFFSTSGIGCWLPHMKSRTKASLTPTQRHAHTLPPPFFHYQCNYYSDHFNTKYASQLSHAGKRFISFCMRPVFLRWMLTLLFILSAFPGCQVPALSIS